MSLDAQKAMKFINDKVLAAMEELTQEVVQDMKQMAPVDTGFLRDNIHGEVTTTTSEVVAEFHSDAPYSIFVDKGTSRMDARPFFDAALVGFERRLKEKAQS